jgi:class 3 adenylate cyclase
MAIVNLEGHRSRGIVWVCDIANSSKYLNSDQSAAALETFLQRLLFMSIVFVEAAGGRFVKWTGDGFLAWFETPLIRDAGEIASAVIRAAWTLSYFVNISQLCVKAPVKFTVRHAITLEHDALFIELEYLGTNAIDVLGRAIVLAFRLSSMKAAFPSIVTHKELLKLVRDTSNVDFKKLKLSKDEKLKYFKGENWGISDLLVSGEKIYRAKSNSAHIRRAKRSMMRERSDPKHIAFAERIADGMENGPEWCSEVEQKMSEFNNHMRKIIADVLPVLEKQLDERDKKAIPPKRR